MNRSVILGEVGSWSGQCVGITGATGFLGTHVALQLMRRGAQVRALVRASSDTRRLLEAGVDCMVAPVEDAVALKRAAAGCEFLLHLAGAVDFSNDLARMVEVNVEGTRRVLAAARSAGVRRVVHASSIVAVGGSFRPQVLDETAAWNLADRRVPYVDTKRRAEEVALQAAAEGQDVVVVNPSCLLGPDDHSNSEFGVLCRRFWRGRVRAHFGGGNNFVDVRDAADGLIRSAQLGRKGERYLLGGVNLTYGAFFEQLCRVSGRRRFWMRLPRLAATAVAHLMPRRPNSRRSPLVTPAQARMLGMYFYFDSGKARRELGLQTRPLAETLADAHASWCTIHRNDRTGRSDAA